MAQEPQRARQDAIDAVLDTPSRELSELAPQHLSLLERDPDLYVRLATWYADHGDVPEHQCLFLGNLLSNPDTSLRAVGCALVSTQAPEHLSTTLTYMKRERGKVPRSTRTAVSRYLANLESNPEALDREALRVKKPLKHLYASLHIRPGPLADRLLFKNDPPLDSLVHEFKELSDAPDYVREDFLRAALSSPITATPTTRTSISRPTALLIDKSSGMHAALALGESLAPSLARLRGADTSLLVYAFDTMPHFVRVDDAPESPRSWADAFSRLRVGGSTSVGCALEAMRIREQYVEQILVLTDEGENTAPYFTPTWELYRRDMGVAPHVVLVKVGHPRNYTETQLRAAQAPLDVFTFESDLDALWGELLPIVTRPSRANLLREILETPLPTS